MRLREILTVLGLAGLGYSVQAIPTVTINDTKGPITVTGTTGAGGFSSFNWMYIGGNTEAVFWYGTVNPLTSSLGIGTTLGQWTDPGSSHVSDQFLVTAAGAMAYGVFVSDPSTKLPTSITLPWGSTLDLSKFPISTSTETGLPTQISPTTQLSVVAASSVADGGSTIILLGTALVGMALLARRLSHSTANV
jgi:hypothetical protein